MCIQVVMWARARECVYVSYSNPHFILLSFYICKCSTSVLDTEYTRESKSKYTYGFHLLCSDAQLVVLSVSLSLFNLCTPWLLTWTICLDIRSKIAPACKHKSTSYVDMHICLFSPTKYDCGHCTHHNISRIYSFFPFRCPFRVRSFT